MKCMLGQDFGGSGGMPGVPPTTKMRSRWLFIVRTFDWWEVKRRRKGRKGRTGEKGNLSAFLPLSGATFSGSVFVPKATATWPAWLMIWEYLQCREVLTWKEKPNNQTKKMNTHYLHFHNPWNYGKHKYGIKKTLMETPIFRKTSHIYHKKLCSHEVFFFQTYQYRIIFKWLN